MEDELRCEIYKKYVAPPNYILPSISMIGEQSKLVIEDLEKFVYDQKCCKHGEKLPVLLCGKRGTGKSLLLQNLAFSLSQTHSIDYSEFLLVLHLDEWGRRIFTRQCTPARDTGTEFWEEVFTCIVSLAPDTVFRYNLDVIKTVIKMYIDEIVFLIDWDIKIGPVCKEMQRGTWVVAYHGTHVQSVDWQILVMQPYGEAQVKQILQGLKTKHTDDVIRLYENCEFKEILTSLDMIKIFSELKSSVAIGTDFEIAEAYVSNQFDNILCINKEDMITALGKIAFHAVCKNKSIFRDSDLCNIHNEIRDKFLVQHGEIGYTFIHNIAEDFLASRYVISQPFKACKEWLGNVHCFKRIFKFVCSVWCRDSRQLRKNLPHIKEYLITLFGIEGMLGDSKPCKPTEQRVEPMEVIAHKKKKQKTNRKIPHFVNPLKDPFTKWGFLIHLDDACHGQREILELLAILLSQIPCWKFKESTHLDDGKLRRIEKILKKVKLSKECPLTIKLESTADTMMLIKIWNKLKNIESLHDYTYVRMTVKHNKSIPLVQQRSVAELLAMIAGTHVPLYITQYTGPFLCSEIPNFLKCFCMRKLERMDVSVYDVASLSEVLSCKVLSSLKDLTVRVDLKKTEQTNLQHSFIEIPKHVNLYLSIKYFANICDLWNRFRCPHRLLSLSIHDLFVDENFKLDLSAFTNLESLYISCEPDMGKEITSNAMDENGLETGNMINIMEIDQDVSKQPGNKKLPRQNWMFAFVISLILPVKIERLMLRNVEFYDNSNNYMLLKFFQKYSIDRLIILDSMLSLKGVRQVISTHTESTDDDLETMTKRLRVDKSDSSEVQALIAKQPRLSQEERENRRKEKPEGKEIIISSELSLCTVCRSFPCLCLLEAGNDNKDTIEDLICLIEDIYCYDILSFTYISNILNVRKDLCGDLRVHCIITELNDDVAFRLDSSRTWLHDLFMTLTIAQCICFDNTDLSSKGAMAVISYLKKIKEIQSIDGKVEPFSLTIGSLRHAGSDEFICSTIINFIRKEKCLAMFNFWCMCKDKCFKLKKAHSGKVFVNDKLINCEQCK
ncbi:uncharacterized protein [Panulirus ornatus]|uniref:uncharacterized protein isoform X2 n=1 Tax=Panulirus ornatus TaxID=150431 RepID=UPI003A86D23F